MIDDCLGALNVPLPTPIITTIGPGALAADTVLRPEDWALLDSCAPFAGGLTFETASFAAAEGLVAVKSAEAVAATVPAVDAA